MNTTTEHKNYNHLSEEELAIYADAVSSHSLNSVPENIMVHVEACTECKKKILFIVEVLKIASSKIHVTDFDESDTFKFVGYKKIFKAAALILIMLGIGALTYYLIIPGKNQEITINVPKKDSTKKETIAVQNRGMNIQGETVQEVNNNKLINKELPLFENLISSNYRGTEAEVFSPKNDQYFQTGEVINFSFRLEEHSHAIIKIYNNKGEKIFEKISSNDSAASFNNNFNPGLYYWKLEDEEDLLFVGKFFVISKKSKKQ